MKKGNETASGHCKFLSEDYFSELYAVFTEAFSDYVFPFALTEQQFKNHLSLTGVDLDKTVGCFRNEKLVGFSLNGFGLWNDKKTVYDAGTGVIPSMRRLGMGRKMFEMMLPQFEAAGIEQFLLEVVTSNTPAVRLYERLGFSPGRRLALLQSDELKSNKANSSFSTRDIDLPDWDLFKSFWDSPPAWQNSPEAIDRSLKSRRIVGAFQEEECIGYVIFSRSFGRIAQIAVDSRHRRLGAASELVRAVGKATSKGYSMQVINVDTGIDGAVAFFEKQGFYKRLEQYEMTRAI